MAESTTGKKEANFYTTTKTMTASLTNTITTTTISTATTTTMNIYMKLDSYQPGDAVDYVSEQ